MRFHFLAARFCAHDHGARLVFQPLRDLICHGRSFRIETRVDFSEPAHAHLGGRAGIDRPERGDVRLDQRQRILDRLAVRRRGLQIRRGHFRNGWTGSGRSDGAHRIGECLRLIRLNQIAANGIQRRPHRDGLAVDREDRFVAGLHRHVLDVLVVETVGHREAIHFHTEFLFDHLLGAGDLVLEPLLVLGRAQFFLGYFVVRPPQILVRGRVPLNIDTGIAHLRELVPAHRFAAAEVPRLDAFGVNEERDGVVEFFQDRPGDFVLRFPAVVESKDRAFRGDRFLAAPPRKKILHGNHSDPLVLQLLHLRFERLRRDLRVGPPDVVNETVITEDYDLRVLIDDGLRGNRRSRGGDDDRLRCRSGRGRGSRRGLRR